MPLGSRHHNMAGMTYLYRILQEGHLEVLGPQGPCVVWYFWWLLACVESTPEHGSFPFKANLLHSEEHCEFFHLQQPRKIHVDRPSSYAQASVPCELGCSANQLTLHLWICFHQSYSMVVGTVWFLSSFGTFCNLAVALSWCQFSWVWKTSHAMRWHVPLPGETVMGNSYRSCGRVVPGGLGNLAWKVLHCMDGGPLFEMQTTIEKCMFWSLVHRSVSMFCEFVVGAAPLKFQEGVPAKPFDRSCIINTATAGRDYSSWS